MEENNNDIYQNKYSKLNKVLRILGFILLPLGIICTLTGMIDFFVAASKFGAPKLFFLCFIGTGASPVGESHHCPAKPMRGEIDFFLEVY